MTPRLTHQQLNPEPSKPDPRTTAMREAAQEALADIALTSPPLLPSIHGKLPDTVVKLLSEYYLKSIRYGMSVHVGDASGAESYAANCWRQALPELSTHRDVLTFIACIAWGARNRIIAPQDAKMLMYVAQTQLTVLKLIRSAEREQTPLPLLPSHLSLGGKRPLSRAATPPGSFHRHRSPPPSHRRGHGAREAAHEP